MSTAGPELPSGTVTFLFTDIEGSTRLLKQLGERYGDALATHQRILREAFAEHGGREIDTQGDSFFVAFRRARDAVGAANAAQRALASEAWPDGTELRVRMAIHTGEPTVGSERYIGLGVHRAARICAVGHGGQVLVSQTTRELLRDDPLPEVSVRDLGEHELKDLDEPERIYQLVAPGLMEDFPALRTAAPAPFEGREGELAEAARDAIAPASPWRRHGRALAVVAGVAVVAVGVGVGLAVTGGGGTANASGPVPGNAVGLIDAKSGKVASQIPVGAAPGGVAAAPDALWVANADDGSVSRIDPATNTVRQTIPVGGGPAGVAANGDTVWVTNGLDGTVSRIDTAANRVVQTIPVGNGPTGIAYGDGAVWVANSVDGTVVRIDPDSGRVTRTLPAVVGAGALAVQGGRIWVVSPAAGTVTVLDAKSGEIVDTVGVGGDPSAIAASRDAIWVANRADGTVSRIDPRARQVVHTTTVGPAPAALAVGAGGVWVGDSRAGTLTRINPATDAVSDTISVGNPVSGAATSGDGVYVAVRSTGASHRGGTLRVRSPFGADFIDPALSYSFDGWALLSMTNDGLVGFRRVGGVQGVQLVPDLALSLPTATNAGLSYTFRLRPGIRYSNGKPVQPEDFRRAIERLFEIRPASPGAHYFAGIVGAGECGPGRRCDLSKGIVTDSAARTVTFRLTAPDADFLAKLALPFAVAIPAGTPPRNVGTHPLPATGPYTIASWRPNHSVRLVRNPRFHEWAADAQPDGYPDVVEWEVQNAGAARVRAVTGGKADIARALDIGAPPEQIAALATRYPSQLRLSTQPATHYFFLNTRVPPFDDVRVRRAINYAFDRSAYARLLGRDYAPTCQILPPNYPSYRRTCPYRPSGPAGLAKALALIRASGTSGESVTVWMQNFGTQPSRGRFMVSLLRRLGYRAKLRLVAPDRYFDIVGDSRKRAQIGFGGWGADFPSQSGFLQVQFSCSASAPGSPQLNADPSELCDPRIDRAMVHAAKLQSNDPAAAGAAWQRVERDLLAVAPVVPTANPKNVDLLSKRVGNYEYNPQFGPLLDQLWVR